MSEGSEGSEGSAIDELARAIDRGVFALEELRGALASPGDPRHHLALVALERRSAAAEEAAILRACAALLPAASADEPASAALLALLYRRLWRFLPAPRLPPWRGRVGDPSARAAWLRTEACVQPSALADADADADDPALAEALAGIELDEVDDPAALLEALAGRREEAAQACAARLLAVACERGALLPAQAHGLARGLLRRGSPRVALAALAALSSTWSLGQDFQASELSAALAGGEALARAALECAARRGLEGPLRALAGDLEAPPRLRQEALRALGGLVGPPAIPALQGLALEDPPLLGAPCLEALERLHRRGRFVDEAAIPGLLALFARTPGFAAERLVALAYTARRGLFAALVERPPAALAPARRIALALALARAPQGATPLPVEAWLLGHVEDADEGGAAALDALARLGAPAAEEAALRRLDRDPAGSLAALRRVGGPATISALRARLGIAPEGPIAGPLLAHVGAAVDLLWHLCADDRDAREALLTRLGDRDVTPAILGDLGGGLSPQEAALLARRERTRGRAARSLSDEVAALDGLTRLESAALLPAIGEHLRAIVSAVAAGAIDDEALHGEAQRIAPARALAALRGLGAALWRRGRIRPVALVDAESERSAGDALIAELLLDHLAAIDPDDDAAIAEVLLRSLAEVDDRRILAAVQPLLRSPSPTLRKLAIPLIARAGGGPLATSMRARIAADDIETARQAVIALAEVGGDAASGALVLALEHPNMNIKKAAAAGLVRCGDAEAIDRLLFWLGHHDNPGLRTELLAALRALLGATLPMTILAAIAAAEDGRRRGLLLDALAEGIDPLAIRAALRGDGGAWIDELLARVDDGRVPLTRPLAGLAAELDARRRRGDRPAEGQARATAIIALERRRLDPEVADGLLELRRQRPLRGDELALLRPHLAGWLELCAAAEAPPLAHLRLVVEALRRPLTSDEAALLARRRGLLFAGLTAAEGSLALSLFELLEALIDALDVGARWLVGVDLRALVTASRALLWGRSPITALRRCGLLVTRGDVEAALLAARRSADPPELQRRILRDAFVGGERPSITAGALSKAAREALGRALKSPEENDLTALRARWEAPPRATIAALVDAYPDLDGAHQGPLLDWLCELQPPGSPLDARPPLPPAPSERRPRASDLDQPISEVQLDRLRAELDDPKRSRAAATRLLERAEHLTPALRDHLLQLYLGGALGPADPLGRPALAALAETLVAGEPPALAEHLADPAWLARLDNLVHGTGSNRPLALLPALVDAWPRAPEADGARRRIRAMIDAFSPEAVRLALQAPLLRGEWGYLGLLRAPLRPSTLDAALRDAARQGGGEALLARVDALHAPPTPPPDPPAAIPSEALVDRPRDELFALLRDTDRRGPLDAQAAALKALARAPDAPFVALCRELVAHPHPRLRLAAYRQLRRHGTRDEALAAARQLLGDPRPDIQRSAIASLGHARDLAALPALVELTGHRHNGVRRAAIDALRLYGAPAREALEIALRGARPDRRRALAEVLTLIDGPPG